MRDAKRDHVRRPFGPAENRASNYFERAAGGCQERGGLAAMRLGSPEPCRGECGFVIEKTFRTRPTTRLVNPLDERGWGSHGGGIVIRA